jgi:hypothetical protein
LPNLLIRFSAADGFIHVSDNTILFPESGMSHIIVVCPLHCYEPRLDEGSGGWKRAARPSVQPAETLDLFHGLKNTWFYLGTYKCLFKACLEQKQLLNIINSVCLNLDISY